MFAIFSKMTIITDKGDYLKYLLIWRILLLHVCVFWIMKRLLQEKYLKINNHYNSDKQNYITSIEKIEKLIHEFIRKESNNFNYMSQKIIGNNEIIKEKYVFCGYKNQRMSWFLKLY
jgi:hypothetical protein